MFLSYILFTRVENVYRINKKKVGIGSSLSLLFCAHQGYHPQIKVKKVPMTYISDGLKKILVLKQDLLSLSLKKTMEDNLIKQVKLNTYQGNSIRHALPLHGQRRRTNATTARKLLSKVVSRMKK
jgi:small subunit ribosomal protein S13